LSIPNTNIMPSVRLKREWVVRITPNNIGLPEPPSGHVFYALANFLHDTDKQGVEDLRTTLWPLYSDMQRVEVVTLKSSSDYSKITPLALGSAVNLDTLQNGLGIITGMIIDRNGWPINRINCADCFVTVDVPVDCKGSGYVLTVLAASAEFQHFGIDLEDGILWKPTPEAWQYLFSQSVPEFPARLHVKRSIIRAEDDFELSFRIGMPWLEITPSNLVFTMIEGGNAPKPLGFSINNKIKTPLNWTAELKGHNANNFSLKPTSGNTAQDLLMNAPSLTVSVVNSGVLTRGNYTATVVIDSKDASNSPQEILLSLDVTAEPKLIINPDKIGGDANAGIPTKNIPPIEISIHIENVDGETTWKAVVLDVAAGPGSVVAGLSLDPSEGQLSGSNPSPIKVSLDTTTFGANLKTGKYTNTIHITTDGAAKSSKDVTFSMIVT
jgi:hypothetical protein